MAIQEQLAILRQGVQAWNQWRKEHADMPTSLESVDLSEVQLEGANFSGTSLWGADLTGANLSGANLSGANFGEARLSAAHLDGADIREAIFNRADLRAINFTGADLRAIEFTEANLSSQDLSSHDLSGAYLSGADLSRANLSGADLRGADLSDADLRGADLSDADLSRARLVGTNFAEATLTNCNIYGISVWNVKLDGARQDSLVITPKGEPTIKVDDLEVAQFIYLLLSHQKLRNVLNAVTAKGVLILGRFGGGGLEVLQAIAAKLREGGYIPILFDFERPRDQDYTETIMTLAGLSHFIIADLSGPSVPQELSHTIPFRSIPLVPIIEKGKKTYSMFPDFMKYPWVIKPPIKFRNIEQLQQLIPAKIIPLAEKKQQSRQKQLEKLFPRKQGGEDTKSKTAG